jgi:hypothetical protein
MLIFQKEVSNLNLQIIFLKIITPCPSENSYALSFDTYVPDTCKLISGFSMHIDQPSWFLCVWKQKSDYIDHVWVFFTTDQFSFYLITNQFWSSSTSSNLFFNFLLKPNVLFISTYSLRLQILYITGINRSTIFHIKSAKNSAIFRLYLNPYGPKYKLSFILILNSICKILSPCLSAW